LESVLVTARYRREDAQTVPISMSIIGGDTLDASHTISLSQLTELVPTLNYSSPNPRNTALTIRGLGSSVVAVAQANDGLEPGVGFYVDQVYHARPATAAFDFLDLERVEVLRGPQGTLFGKNTTAGAMNISTRAPSFTPEFKAELTTGNLDYHQARLSATGPLLDNRLAGRISVVMADREGVLDNVTTGRKDNDVDNKAIRTQLLYQPGNNFSLRVAADYYAIDTRCCTQVYHSVGATLKPAAQQYPAMAAGQSYAPPSLDPFDRVTDIDADLKVTSHEGGVSAIAEWSLDNSLLTSVSAWRFWKWAAANDRDYTGLVIQTVQGIPSRQDQYSQELRLSSTGERAVDYTAGLYFFTQTIKAKPSTAYGPLASYWLLGSTTPAALLDGYRTDGKTRFQSDSYAAFGEVTWHVTDTVDISGGLRYTYEEKEGDYQADVSGGLANPTAAQLRQKNSILRAQFYSADDTDGSLSGRFNVAWRYSDQVMPYLTVARAQKSGGINMSGLPLQPDNLPALTAAVINPEKNTTVELGVKAQLFADRMQLNADIFDTRVRDFQANVVDTGPGALRGYLANIDEVRVKGIEVDGSVAVTDGLALRFSVARTDGEYVSYQNGPCPLELTGTATSVCDLSGKPLASLPKLVLSGGFEYERPAQVLGMAGNVYLRSDITRRDDSNAQSSISQYTWIDGYNLVNTSVGFMQGEAWDLSLWLRNVLKEEYMQTLTVQAGNSGLIVGLPSDPATYGLTLRATY
jgi:iron complex outermembrane receptor protein